MIKKMGQTIDGRSSMGDEDDVGEIPHLEERPRNRLTAGVMRKAILAILVVSGTVLGGIGLNQIYRAGRTTDPLGTATVGNGSVTRC